MSLNQLIDDALHDRHVERATNTAGVEDVVSGVAGLQLVYEPEPLLVYRRCAPRGVAVLSARDGLHCGDIGTQPLLFQTNFKQGALFRCQRRDPVRNILHYSSAFCASLWL